MENKIRDFYQKNKELCYFILIAIVIATFTSLRGSESPKKVVDSVSESADTFIPEGYSLVPIEIANYETLDSLLGQFGIVDLFTHNPLQVQQSQKIATHVKILRAPKNPSHFAILVPHAQAQYILKHSGPFMASVKNPKHNAGTSFGKEKVKKHSRIVFEE